MSRGAQVLVVDDDADMLHLLSMRLDAAGYRVTVADSAEAALAHIAVSRPHVVLSDVQLPGRDGLSLFDEIHARDPALPVILITAHGTIPDAVAATARGVFSYLTKPFDGKDLLAKIAQALDVTASAPEWPLENEPWRAGIVSRSSRMAEVLTEAKMVARSDASILIRGESGSGKELLAQAIHRASARASGPFVPVNCAAIPAALLESELFGHVRGAFTGAVSNHPGLFKAAEGGTLFLDEIGDMPPDLQVKLLRVLQDRMVRPVGSSQPVAIDVRVISATHRNLEEAMASGEFREDLYYRLNVVTLVLPNLAERREDIPLLANYFLAPLAVKYGKQLNGFAPDAMRALAMASWPGNVRQLYNVVEQVCALVTTPLIPLSLVQRALRVPGMPMLTLTEARLRFDREYFVALLKLTDGSVPEAAQLAGRNRTEFYRLLQKHGLVAGMFRSGEGDEGSTTGSYPVAD